MSDVGVLLRASIPSSARNQRALLLLIAGAVAALLICDGVIGAGVSRYARSVQYQSALNLVEISSIGPGATRSVDDVTLREVAKVAGVTGVYPWFQVDLAMTDSTDWPDADVNPGALWATPVIPGLAPKPAAGSIPTTGLKADQIALPETVAGGSLKRLLGKQVTMEYTKVVSAGVGEPARRVFTVVAIVDNETPGRDGPTPSYVSSETLQEMYIASGASRVAGGPQLTSAYVRATNAEAVPRVQQELSRQGFAVNSVASQLGSLTGLFAVLGWASKLLAIVLLAFCLVVGGSVGSNWVRQRRREIGLLVAIGWSRRRIATTLLAELGLVGAAAGALGVVAGLAGSLVATTVVAGRELDVLPIDPWSLPSLSVSLLALVLVPVCVCLGGLANALRACRLDADVALRDLT